MEGSHLFKVLWTVRCFRMANNWGCWNKCRRWYFSLKFFPCGFTCGFQNFQRPLLASISDCLPWVWPWPLTFCCFQGLQTLKSRLSLLTKLVIYRGFLSACLKSTEQLWYSNFYTPTLSRGTTTLAACTFTSSWGPRPMTSTADLGGFWFCFVQCWCMPPP